MAVKMIVDATVMKSSLAGEADCAANSGSKSLYAFEDEDESFTFSSPLNQKLVKYKVKKFPIIVSIT